MKIIHLAVDDKFLDHAFPVFEAVYPGANDVFVFAAKTPLKYVKLKPDHIETKRSSFFYKKAKLGQDPYSKYDLVIFHSLGPSTYPELLNIPKDTPTIWLGWGFDYYLELLHEVPLYLEKTQDLCRRLAGATLKRIGHGPIVAQKAISINSWDTSKSVYERVLDAEFELYDICIERIIKGDFEEVEVIEEGNYNSISDFEDLCQIDLNRKLSLKEAINYFRAMSFQGYDNAYFYDENRKNIFVIEFKSF